MHKGCISILQQRASTLIIFSLSLPASERHYSAKCIAILKIDYKA